MINECGPVDVNLVLGEGNKGQANKGKANKVGGISRERKGRTLSPTPNPSTLTLTLILTQLHFHVMTKCSNG